MSNDSRTAPWLLDRLEEGVVLVDPDGAITFLNRMAAALLGVDGAGPRGKPADDAGLPLPGEWLEALRDGGGGGGARRLGSVEVQQGGRHRHLDGEVVAAPAGGAALVLRDVTGRKLEEETLRLRDRAMSASINGIVLTDASQPDNPIIYVNPSFTRITGYAPDEVLGRNCRFLQGDDRDQPGLNELRRAVRHGRSCAVVLRNYRKDGSLFWNELSIAPVRDDAGRLTHFVGIQQDITERKRAQDDLVERNAELKSARDELAERNAELREATHAKDRFMATMSHEMRTPLNAILGYVELLRIGVPGELSEGQQAHLNRIAASGRALLDLINDVLDFTRAEAGRLGVEVRPLNAEAVVAEAVELVRPEAQSKGVELRVERAPGLPSWVRADFRRLRQILLNLLSNAVKFTPRGEVMVRLAPAEGERVRIAVADTGIGIAPEQLPHVFKEFYQADADLTREYGGTGLGLAISQRLARLMGGEISVASEPGRGSTFTLFLPATTEPAREEPLPAPGPEEPPAEQDRPIAVVAFAPDRAALDGLERQVRSAVRLIGTTVPDNVPELVRRERAALVVLDVAGQGGAGWEAAHAVREDPELDDVALLLLPCLPSPAEMGAPGALDLGWVAVVPKPFASDQLLRMVQRAAPSGAAGGGADRALDVLVVDDDPDARRIAGRILTAAGAQVREADDGEAGLAAMRRATPDVAVVDLMMPVLDGFGVLAAMRADPALRDIPVVVLTAKDLSIPERRFLAREAETVLEKGVHPLADVATLVLRAAQGREGAPRTGAPAP